MSSDVVIRAERLGKKYVIGHESAERERYTALRDVIGRGAKNLARSTMDMVRGRQLVAGDTTEEFWALKDINFEVRRGEVVGIIGRNGAGKSTLLKILSRITEPSEGRVEIKGRVASLLEVGTGFHPELTGRENVYLNGAILGMTRAEIRRKFDEIIAFAEIEKFLDTPVKRYSSGMYVRLAFAVAAHLEPDILVVDEVLAVGDAEFQKKCLGKMSEVAGGGRTVLFVSHNLPAVTALCTRAILLAGGVAAFQGNTADAVSKYLGEQATRMELVGKRIQVSARLEHKDLTNAPAMSLIFKVVLRGSLAEPRVVMGISDARGSRIATVFSETSYRLPRLESTESVSFEVHTEPIRLSPGSIFVRIALADGGPDIESYEDAFHIIIPDYTPFEMPPHSWPQGPVLLKGKITVLDRGREAIASTPTESFH